MADVPEPQRERDVDLDIELDLPNGAWFRFRCNTGVAVVLGVTGVTLGVLFGKEALRPAVKRLFGVVFGACNLTEGSILVDVDCFTYKRAKDLLDDYLCGNLKRHFLEELRKMGGKVEDLKIRFEVEETLKLNKDRLRHFEREEKESQKEDIPKSGMSKQEFREVLESIEKLKGVEDRYIHILSRYQMGMYLLLEWTDWYDEYGRTLLHYATRFGYKAVLKCIMSGANINSQDCDGRTALHLMCIRTDAISHLFEINSSRFQMHAVCRLFILNGIDINAKDSEGRTALHYAAIYDRQFISSLISSNADMYATDGNGKTPFDYAFENSNTKAIGVLAGQFAKRGTEKEERFIMKDVNAVDKDGKTILHHAAEVLEMAEIRGILDIGVSANILDNNGKSALDYAFEQKNLQSAVALLASVLEDKDTKKLAFRYLNQKEYLKMVDSYGRTILHYSAMFSKQNLFDLLLTYNVNVNDRDLEGMSPLHCVAESGNIAAAKKLLKAGANAEGKDRRGETVLHYAARRGDEKLFDLLIENNKNVNEIDSEGKSPLHYAAESNNSTAAEKLLKAGASVEGKDKDGKTVLHYAAQRGNEKLVDLLIENNKTVNEIDRDGKSALHYAAESNNSTAAEKLIKAGASAEGKDRWGKTVLHYAAQRGDEKLFDLLIENNKDVNEVDDEGKSALHYAVESNNFAVAEKLIKAGASVEEKDRWGKTVLHYAVRHDNEKLLHLLLENNKSVNEIDRDGKSALHYATESNNSTAAEQLRKAGASLIDKFRLFYYPRLPYGAQRT